MKLGGTTKGEKTVQCWRNTELHLSLDASRDKGLRKQRSLTIILNNAYGTIAIVDCFIPVQPLRRYSVVGYDSLQGTRLISLRWYNTDVGTCIERVLRFELQIQPARLYSKFSSRTNKAYIDEKTNFTKQCSAMKTKCEIEGNVSQKMSWKMIIARVYCTHTTAQTSKLHNHLLALSALAAFRNTINFPNEDDTILMKEWRTEDTGRNREGRSEVLTEQPYFGKKGGTLNFIDVAHGAMQARTIEPGSVCDGRLAKEQFTRRQSPFRHEDGLNSNVRFCVPHTTARIKRKVGASVKSRMDGL
ncbi:hypothetical protein WN51_14019 [Melipona quadrifasciata]|uniref:Uncharacterized protein n=1 Tax=Melipona quadrifasciata TaxID=166423 RepID=A0A0N0BG24_9HYME|nr:hypothetical protein WN51_14019 [Melipona quadrifasciata]